MHKRIDANQKEIVQVARNLGATVQILSDIGSGCPDILIGYKNKNILIEIKDGSKPPSCQVLTIKERNFHDTWKGQVAIVNSIDSLVNLFSSITYDK